MLIYNIVGDDLMLCYCKKCGRIVLFIIEDKLICDCCKSEVFPIPQQFLKSEFSINEELKQQFIDEYVKISPEFDQYLFDHRDEILAKQSAEFNAKMAHGKAILEEQSRRATCSYCGSSNVKKIGLLNRAVSTELWGLGSKKIGKQWHCNNCNSDF